MATIKPLKDVLMSMSALMPTSPANVEVQPRQTATIPLDPILVHVKQDMIPGRQTAGVETSMNAVKDPMLSVLTLAKGLLPLMGSVSMLLDPLIVKLVVLEELSSVPQVQGQQSSAILRLTIKTMYLMEQGPSNGLSVYLLERGWS